MRMRFRIAWFGLLLAGAWIVALAADFQWNWRDQQALGRMDPSVGNTSKLTEPERAELISAIALRLEKPMSDAGYDSDRIREIASTTRLRFVDLGDGKPLIFASAITLEAGCDALVNCPFWIFRHTDDGYIAVVDAVAASYTLQPAGAGALSDLVLMHHVSAKEGRLTLYKYADGKYVESGCYTATWPATKDSETQDPTISPCSSAEPGK
jgi:hypothetical protein